MRPKLREKTAQLAVAQMARQGAVAAGIERVVAAEAVHNQARTRFGGGGEQQGRRPSAAAAWAIMGQEQPLDAVERRRLRLPQLADVEMRHHAPAGFHPRPDVAAGDLGGLLPEPAQADQLSPLGLDDGPGQPRDRRGVEAGAHQQCGGMSETPQPAGDRFSQDAAVALDVVAFIAVLVGRVRARRPVSA